MDLRIGSRLRHGPLQDAGRFQEAYTQAIEDLETVDVAVQKRYGPVFMRFGDSIRGESASKTGISGAEALDYIDDTLQDWTQDGEGLDEVADYAEHRQGGSRDHIVIEGSSPRVFGFQDRYRITIDGVPG